MMEDYYSTKWTNPVHVDNDWFFEFDYMDEINTFSQIRCDYQGFYKTRFEIFVESMINNELSMSPVRYDRLVYLNSLSGHP